MKARILILIINQISMDYQELPKQLQGNPDVKKYQQIFEKMALQFCFLSDEQAFKEKYQFDLKEYLEERDKCAAIMRGISDHIDKVAYDCGVAKIVTGSTSIASGLMIGAGLLLAPASGGASLALTIGGAGLAVGSGIGSLTATLVKDSQLHSKMKYAEWLTHQLQPKDQKIGEIMRKIQNSLYQMRKLYDEKSFQQYIVFVGSNGIKGFMQGKKAFALAKNSVQLVKFTKALADIIKIDSSIMRGLALEMAAPQIRFLGMNLATVGSKAAIGMAAFGAILGIVFGTMEVIEGAKDMGGTKQALNLRQNSFSYDAITRKMDDIINLARTTASLPPYDRKQQFVLISKHSEKLFDFEPPNKPVHLWECKGVENQTLIINSGFEITIKNKSNGLFATVDSFQNGTKIKQSAWQKQDGQKFSLVPAKDGKQNEYHILAGSKNVFDVGGWGKDNGTQIILWENHGGDNQRWFLCSLRKQKVNENDCGGFGAYIADMAYAPVSFVTSGVEEIGKGINDAGSAVVKLIPGLDKGKCEIKCSGCKDFVSVHQYYFANDNYSQCNGCGRFNQINDKYYHCQKCSKWGFCRQCAEKGVIPNGCDRQKCGKCKQEKLKSFKFYGGNWNYSNCNFCKGPIMLNGFYWHCSYCNTWGYCYKCTMKGKCGING